MAILGRSQALVAEKEIRNKITNWTCILPITYKHFTEIELPKLVGFESPLTAVNTTNDRTNELRLFDKRGREARISLLDRNMDDDFDLAQIISSAEINYFKVSNNSKLVLKMEERIFLASIVEKVYYYYDYIEVYWDVPIPHDNHCIRAVIQIPTEQYQSLRDIEGEICTMMHNHARSTDFKNVLAIYRNFQRFFLELGGSPKSVTIAFEDSEESEEIINYLSADSGKVTMYKITDEAGCYTRTNDGNWSFTDSAKQVEISFESEGQTFSYKFQNVEGTKINSINLGEITDEVLTKIAKNILPAFK